MREGGRKNRERERRGRREERRKGWMEGEKLRT